MLFKRRRGYKPGDVFKDSSGLIEEVYKFHKGIIYDEYLVEYYPEEIEIVCYVEKRRDSHDY